VMLKGRCRYNRNIQFIVIEIKFSLKNGKWVIAKHYTAPAEYFKGLWGLSASESYENRRQ
jgi:hypothetical protein